ncbi:MULTISPECIES: M48 family metalloprotease [Sphingomonas]|jgi:heat shock protein HtpX|uniref:M48 family metalloprotease n=1 Tax=Sphingomonas TaxID=13687 RepID=UPI0008323525|nr:MULTISPECIES: M48 family metalloprotease [Sphingomonas]MBY0302482.1 M48 family metalloprotease [Sphingomonas ginsenosidimutans]
MNGFKTTMLLAALTALFMALGFTLGGSGGAILALILAAGMNLFTFWNADRIVLSMHRTEEVDYADAPELVGLVRDLAARANLPMPRVYIIDDPSPNAFATGRDPAHAAVAATTGLLSMLTRDELAGVMAHELGHVRNRDTLIMTMVATIAGAVSMLANFGLFFRHGGGRGPGWAGLLAVLVAPFAAMIVQMAISRTREYAADRAGAEISGQPHALASALAKLQRGAEAVPGATATRVPAAQQLYIVPGRSADSLFATHPDTGDRIAALHAIAQEMGMIAPPTGRRAASVPVTRRRASALDPFA